MPGFRSRSETWMSACSADAKHVGQHVPHRMPPEARVGGLLRQNSGCPGIILSHWRQHAIGEQVEPAVADMAHDEPGAGDQRADDSRSHALVVVMPFRLTNETAIGKADGRAQAVAVERQARVDSVRPGVLLAVARLSNEALDRFDREARRNFARCVPTHAIVRQRTDTTPRGRDSGPR